MMGKFLFFPQIISELYTCIERVTDIEINIKIWT